MTNFLGPLVHHAAGLLVMVPLVSLLLSQPQFLWGFQLLGEFLRCPDGKIEKHCRFMETDIYIYRCIYIYTYIYI